MRIVTVIIIVITVVLLTVIGMAMVWVCICCGPPPSKVVIEGAKLTKVGNEYDLTIRVREVGGVSTTITKITLEGPGITETECKFKPGQDGSLSAGQSKTIVAECNVHLEPGVTYYIYVYYKSRGGEEMSGPHAVTPR